MSTPLRRALVALAFVSAPVLLSAQYTVPNVISNPGDVTTTLGQTIVVNHGLVGMGRISASAIDWFGETFGSMSGLQITDWGRNDDGHYTGVLQVLPDRGYNSGAFYSDYAARIAQIRFEFTPYTGTANIGGTTDAERLALQNQIQFDPQIFGTLFTYRDPIHGLSTTTGLDPGTGSTTLFGKTVPYVVSFTGPAAPNGPSQTYTNINKLPLDSEALIFRPDGSGYVGDEYGANVYYFNQAKQIVGVIVPPPAMQPHNPFGVPYYSSAVNPIDGRRPNQGLEGVGLSPNGRWLFVVAQSATMQDSDSNNDQTRRQTRVLLYDVSGSPTPAAPVAEYALTLPTYKANGNGGAVNKTAQQSEVIALDNHRFLILPRDGNGLGNSSNNPSVFKSVVLVDTTGATNLAANAAVNAEGGPIAALVGAGSNEAANLLAGITPATATEVVNFLNKVQLDRFNIALDTGNGQVSKLTLGEKWEGMTLKPAEDPEHPNDYFLFVGNDNDFLTSAGLIKGPGGIVSYNGFDGYPANRTPAPVDSPNNENDSVILAFRVTIISNATLPDTTAPEIVPHVLGIRDGRGGYLGGAIVTWDVRDPETDLVSLEGCSPKVLVRPDTPTTTLTCMATNGAGETNSVSVTVKIDTLFDGRH